MISVAPKLAWNNFKLGAILKCSKHKAHTARVVIPSNSLFRLPKTRDSVTHLLHTRLGRNVCAKCSIAWQLPQAWLGESI